MDLRRRFPRQPVHRNDHGRRDPADGGHLAEHHAVGRAVHDLPLRIVHANLNWTVGPFKYVLGDAGLPSLAPHLAGRGRQHQFRRHLPALGHPVRNVPDAGTRDAGQFGGSTTSRSGPKSVDNWPIRSAAVARGCGHGRSFSARTAVLGRADVPPNGGRDG